MSGLRMPCPVAFPTSFALGRDLRKKATVTHSIVFTQKPVCATRQENRDLAGAVWITKLTEEVYYMPPCASHIQGVRVQQWLPFSSGCLLLTLLLGTTLNLSPPESHFKNPVTFTTYYSQLVVEERVTGRLSM